MEVFGADLQGIEGQLIRFTATKDEHRQGITVLGLAQKVVREGLVRATKAIETLNGNWASILENKGYTIDLSPPETPKTSSGLDLPLAIMLLQASILGTDDALAEKITKLTEQAAGHQVSAARADKRARILADLEVLIKQRDTILKYRKRLRANLNRYLLIGTLDITNGNLQTPYYGMFGMISAARPDFSVIVPDESEAHAALVAAREGEQLEAYVAANLQEVWDVLLGVRSPRRARKQQIKAASRESIGHVPDLRDIDGVSRAKRAVMVAIAGGHNILLVGPPGQGKTMLAKAASQLLPKLREHEVFELNKVYSAHGDLHGQQIIGYRPYREVQSAGITIAALFGGGGRQIRPGEISLAHKGVLLIDEINLCDSNLINQLRLTLSNRIHRVQRHFGTVTFPCNFILFAAMNPCRCGWLDHFICRECGDTFTSKDARCTSHPALQPRAKCQCRTSEIEAYRGRLSRPLLDRIDLKVMVSAYDTDPADDLRYASVTVKRQIERARYLQRSRYQDYEGIESNADIPDRAVFQRIAPPLSDRAKAYFAETARRLDSKRKEVKLLLVARTVADLDESSAIRIRDLREAAELMGLLNPYFQPIA